MSRNHGLQYFWKERKEFHFLQRQHLGRFHCVDNAMLKFPYPLSHRSYTCTFTSRMFEDGSVLQALQRIEPEDDIEGYAVPMEEAEPLRLRRFIHMEPIDEKRFACTMVNRVKGLGGFMDYIFNSDMMVGWIVGAMLGGYDEDIRASEKHYLEHGKEEPYYRRDQMRDNVVCTCSGDHLLLWCCFCVVVLLLLCRNTSLNIFRTYRFLQSILLGPYDIEEEFCI